MVYHRLNIHTDDTAETYNKISELLGIIPTEFENDKGSENEYSVWLYEVSTTDEEPYFDFINNFLDILDSKFTKLVDLGVEKSAISFWYLYEYDQQCSMEFRPEEMKRLGESGITLCIDCWAKPTAEESTTA
jgi:hypothetical protein